MDGNSYEQAYYLYQYSLQLNYQFITTLQNLIKNDGFRVSGSVNQNLYQVAQKIQENIVDEEKGFLARTFSSPKVVYPFRVTDMVRARIEVGEPGQVEEVYGIL